MKSRYLILVSIFVLIFQSIFINSFKLFGVAPNLFFMFIVIFSLLFKNKEGIIFAITSGIVLDLTMSRIIGINTLVFFEVSIILYYLRNIIYSGNMITIVSISVLSTVLYYINSILLNYFLLIRSFSLGVIIKIMIIESIMNAFSAILIYKIMPKKFIINEVKKV